MKPNFHASENYRRDSIETMARRVGPKTDFHFRANSADFSGRCRGEGYPSFRRISDGYFKKEARAHFVSEALVFGLIVVTVAVPVFQAVSGLVRYVYGIL